MARVFAHEVDARIPAEGSEREEFIAMLRAVRCEGAPKVIEMMQILEHEARNAKRDTARVAAARVHLRHTFEASQMLHELEAGIDSKQGYRPAIQILVTAPNGAARAPSPEELKAIMVEVSDSVRAESEAPKVLEAECQQL